MVKKRVEERKAKKRERGLQIKKMLEAGEKQKDIVKKLSLCSATYYSSIAGLEINKPKFVIKDEKVCTVCGELKKLKEYNNQKNNRDGKMCECRECMSIKRKRKRAKNV